MAEVDAELNLIKPEFDRETRLSNYAEFRRCAKALSHIKVKRSAGYFHHFIIISVAELANNLDAVTVGHYTSSGKIFTESSQGIGQFVRDTYILGEDKFGEEDTHSMFDFTTGLYLVQHENYPKTKETLGEAFTRLDEMIDERMYELSSNNCEHSINYILTGKDIKSQTDTKMISKRCCIDLCDVVLVDCKDVGFKTALAVAALGAIAGALVRRAYVKIIVAAIVSYTFGNIIGNCDKKIGSNIRSEAKRRINLARKLPDINKAVVEDSTDILDNMKNHLNTTFVCNITDKLIREATLKTCFATLTVAVGIETVFLLFYVHFNLLSKRRRKMLREVKFCRILFLRIFGGYGSIIVAAVAIGSPVFLYIDRPALAFFGLVFIGIVSIRYILTVLAGFCFDHVDCGCSSCCFRCCSCSCCSCCEPCCSYRCYKCSCSTIFVVTVVLLIIAGIICSLVLYFLK